MSRGVPGVLHGARSLFLQDEDGQIREAHSISAGLDYPGVGPEHAQLAAAGRARYESATDDEAIAGFQLLSVTEGIMPALEPAHAIGWLAREAGRSVPSGTTVLVTLSGRGDKDAAQIAERLTGERLCLTCAATVQHSKRTCAPAARSAASCSCRTSPAGSVRAGSTSCAPSPTRAPTRSRSGIPFSDPVMDGLTIQEASRRAARSGRDAGGRDQRRGRRSTSTSRWW